MKLTYAIPVLGALAFVASLPASAEARSRSRSSYDISIGLGHSSYGGYHHRSHYSSGVSFRYSRGYDGYHGHSRSYYSPRYYSPRPVYHETYYYRPAPRIYYDDCGYDYGYTRYYRPVYRPRYYSGYYCD